MCFKKKQIQKGCYIKKQKHHDLIYAYILANTYSRILNQIILDADKLRDILSVAIVSGNRDIIIRSKVKNLKDLMIVSEKVKYIEGVKEVVTNVVEKKVLK
jgi:hypothetical protein